MNKLHNIEKHVSATKHVDRIRLERHEFIKSTLRLNNTSLAALGRELGVGNSTMTTVSQGIARSKRVQQRLALAVNMPVDELFPETATTQDIGDVK